MALGGTAIAAAASNAAAVALARLAVCSHSPAVAVIQRTYLVEAVAIDAEAEPSHPSPVRLDTVDPYEAAVEYSSLRHSISVAASVPPSS